MWERPRYWLDDSPRRNFGDALSDLLYDRLFVPGGVEAAEIRIIGSSLDDGMLTDGAEASRPAISWGCGLRTDGGLSPRNRDRVRVLAVRGPLTRSALGLGNAVPLGDPALLLPAVHGQRDPSANPARLVVPHFNDDRSDEQLLAASGCDAVLRPAVRGDRRSLTRFIDRLLDADFVLAGALHAAIVRVAYGRSFAFWDSGRIDLPFKWRDFAASIGVEPGFSATAHEGEAWYARHGRSVTPPPLLPLLLSAPYLARPGVVARVAELDRRRRPTHPLATWEGDSLDDELVEALVDDRIARLSEIAEGAAALRDAAAELEQLTLRHDAALAAECERTRLASDEAEALRSRVDDLVDQVRGHAETTREHERAMAEYRAILSAVEEARDAAQAERDAVRSTLSWRVTSPLRRTRARLPRTTRFATRVIRLAWWSVTLQLPRRLAQRRALRRAASAAGDGGQPTDAREITVHFDEHPAPEVSIVIPVYGRSDLLRSCLQALAATAGEQPSFEVILVDDKPEERATDLVAASPGLATIRNADNLGFLRSCNLGALSARGRYLCFLNSDAIPEGAWLSHLLKPFGDSRVGATGPLLVGADGAVQEAGWLLDPEGWGVPVGRGASPDDPLYSFDRDVDCVTGACLVTPRDLFTEMGGFDQVYAPAFYEEFDYAMRLRRADRVARYVASSRVVHLGSGSYGEARRDELSARNHRVFAARFADDLRGRTRPSPHPIDAVRRSPRSEVVVVVEAEVPDPRRHAGDVTIDGFLHSLRDLGHVVMFCAIRGARQSTQADRLRSAGIGLIDGADGLRTALETFGDEIDHILVARPEVCAAILDDARALTRARVHYYTHDVHHVRLERESVVRGDAALRTEAVRMRALEMQVFRSVDTVLAPSDDEVAIVRALAPATPAVRIPPYQFETDAIVSRDRRHFEGLENLLFVGGFPHTPNVDAAVFLIEEVMPLVWRERDVAVTLVGYRPPAEVRALAGPRVEVTGQVPRLEPYFARARLLVAPLRFGAGVKGKTVMAMSQGVPVVGTTIAFEGIEGIGPETAVGAESAEEFARAILDLLGDPARCARLSGAAAGLIRARYSRVESQRALESVLTPAASRKDRAG